MEIKNFIEFKRKPKTGRITRLVITNANEWAGYCWGGTRAVGYGCRGWGNV